MAHGCTTSSSSASAPCTPLQALATTESSHVSQGCRRLGQRMHARPLVPGLFAYPHRAMAAPARAEASEARCLRLRSAAKHAEALAALESPAAAGSLAAACGAALSLFSALHH